MVTCWTKNIRSMAPNKRSEKSSAVRFFPAKSGIKCGCSYTWTYSTNHKWARAVISHVHKALAIQRRVSCCFHQEFALSSWSLCICHKMRLKTQTLSCQALRISGLHWVQTEYYWLWPVEPTGTDNLLQDNYTVVNDWLCFHCAISVNFT